MNGAPVPFPSVGGALLRALLPFAVLAAGAAATSLAGAWRRTIGPAGATVTIAVAALFALLRAAGPLPRASFAGGSVVSDLFGTVVTLLFLAAGLFTILLSRPVLVREGRERAEYYGLLLFSLSGMALLVATTNLLTLFLALELTSLPLYVLAGYPRCGRSGEAALKYFLLGSFSSAILLFGAALLYGATGTIDLAAMRLGGGALGTAGALLLLTGFFFKVAIVPFHMWAPDVYDGAPTPVASFLATAGKLAGFAVLLRLFDFGVAGGAHPFALLLHHGAAPGVLAWLAILTMTAGNLSALTQNNLKRMLAYSSIAHAGYLFLGLVPGSGGVDGRGILYYLIAYLFMTTGAFAVLTALSSREKGREVLHLDRFAGVGHRRPFLGGAMTLFMLSLGGIPPTAGFFGKYLLFRGAVERGLTTLVIVAVLNSALSLYYYLRVVVFFYMKETDRPASIDGAAALRIVPLAMAILLLWAGFFPDIGPIPGVPALLDWFRAAAASLF